MADSGVTTEGKALSKGENDMVYVLINTSDCQYGCAFNGVCATDEDVCTTLEEDSTDVLMIVMWTVIALVICIVLYCCCCKESKKEQYAKVS